MVAVWEASSTMTSYGTCQCARDGAVEWIRVWFGDCVYNSKDYAGFVFGMASIACWLVAQLPQFYSNFRSGSAEGLSPWFLAEWLLGDTFNLLGCLMTGDQLPSEVYTAAYFMCVDVVMIFQFVYYTLRSREALGIITSDLADPTGDRRDDMRTRLLGDKSDDESDESGDDEGNYLGPNYSYGITTREQIDRIQTPPPAVLSGRTHVNNGRRGTPSRVAQCTAVGAAAIGVAMGIALVRTGGHFNGKSARTSATQNLDAQSFDAPLMFNSRLTSHTGPFAEQTSHTDHTHQNSQPTCGTTNNPDWEVTFGRAVGYVSALFYLGSRVSQILKNKQRRSVEGLSITMFATAAVANILYGTAIIVRANSLKLLAESTPWLLGSLGTVALDTTILVQSKMYGGNGDEIIDDEDEIENELDVSNLENARL